MKRREFLGAAAVVPLVGLSPALPQLEKIVVPLFDHSKMSIGGWVNIIKVAENKWVIMGDNIK